MKLKYSGEQDRMVHLSNRHFKVKKGDSFEVNAKELLKFKDKKQFGKVK